mmetsp:Transcript_16763/g.40967  ORF Transcript_16763/g.40967 Transcript_16763/m.40967 type:complete len:310 (-) Transcript_16763:167-1096(-)
MTHPARAAEVLEQLTKHVHRPEPQAPPKRIQLLLHLPPQRLLRGARRGLHGCALRERRGRDAACSHGRRCDGHLRRGLFCRRGHAGGARRGAHNQRGARRDEAVMERGGGVGHRGRRGVGGVRGGDAAVDDGGKVLRVGLILKVREQRRARLPRVAVDDLLEQLDDVLADLAAEGSLEVAQEILDHHEKLELAHTQGDGDRGEGLGEAQVHEHDNLEADGEEGPVHGVVVEHVCEVALLAPLLLLLDDGAQALVVQLQPNVHERLRDAQLLGELRAARHDGGARVVRGAARVEEALEDRVGAGLLPIEV